MLDRVRVTPIGVRKELTANEPSPDQMDDPHGGDRVDALQRATDWPAKRLDVAVRGRGLDPREQRSQPSRAVYVPTCRGVKGVHTQKDASGKAAVSRAGARTAPPRPKRS